MSSTVAKDTRAKIRANDCLGIFLCWSRSRGSLIWMQMVFGMTYSNLSVYLANNFGKGEFRQVVVFKQIPRRTVRVLTCIVAFALLIGLGGFNYLRIDVLIRGGLHLLR